MTTRTLLEGAPRASDHAPAAATPRSHPAVLGLAAALLLFGAFPPAGWGWLGWVALVPLFLLLRSERPRRTIYLGGWLGGLTFWLLALHWITRSDEGAWLAWIVMALALSAWWPAFLLLGRLAVLRLRLPAMVAAPVVWVALEFVRAYAVTGFPWYYLAHTQYRVLPLIQIADVTGAWGLSFLMAMANAWGADLVTLPLLRATPRGPRLARGQAVRSAVLVVAVGATVAYGLFRVATARFRPGPRVALLQSNFKQEYKMSLDAEQILAVYRGLVERALRDGEPPDLIVWPETSYPYGYSELDPALARAAFEGQVRSISRDAKAEVWQANLRNVPLALHGWADRIGVPLLIGSASYHFRTGGLARYNSALLFEPGVATVQMYHKLHLVPFGEYVPLIETFPWLMALTPFEPGHVPSLDFGSQPRWFDRKGWRLAPAICFEDTVPYVVRRFFTEVRDGHQPDLLLNLSNDGWFVGTAEPEVHLATSVFRAVENRVPLARAVNTGISALINGNGAILKSLPHRLEGILSVTAPLDDRVSFYTSWGDWLPRTCLVLSLGLAPLALVRAIGERRRARAPGPPPPNLPKAR